MLFFDREFITVEMLKSIDGEIESVAKHGKVQLTPGRDSIIRRVIAECANQSANNISQHSQPLVGISGGVSASHMAAVLNTGSVSDGSRSVAVAQAVVDDTVTALPTPLAQWVTWKAALAIYGAAIGQSGGSDRAKDKESTAREGEAQAWRQLVRTTGGLLIVTNPLPAPGAELLTGMGVWDSDRVTTPVGTLATDSYWVAITFTGETYVDSDNPKNGESATSRPVQVNLDGIQEIAIDISTLPVVPPAGIPGVAPTWETPTGWNVYVGTGEHDLRLQNATPIPVATKTHNVTTFDATGAIASTGQTPIFRRPLTGGSEATRA